MKHRIVLAGGSGFIGKKLSTLFKTKGYEVTILSRTSGENRLIWDAKTVGDWWSSLDGAHTVINLTGENINQKFTEESKAKIRSSRIDSTKAIHEAIEKCDQKPFWINASAIGFYGSGGDQILDESAPSGSGFLGEVCEEWEQLPRQHQAGIIRIGIVLHPEGGALKPLDMITKFFIGGAAGDGNQWMPWIHIDDLCEMIAWIAENRLAGPTNLCAPNPVTNAEFMETLRKVRNRPWSPPAPKFMLDLIGKTIGPDSSLVLNSTRCIPKRAIDQGYPFKFPNLEPALKDLLS
jgi:uncharacterized protein